MEVLLSLWAGGSALLYSQLGRDGESIQAMIDKVVAFQDLPPLLQANVAAVALISGLIVLKVRQVVVNHPDIVLGSRHNP